MPEPHTFVVFGLASLALIAVPGPAVIYIVTRSLSQGRSAGLISMLGVEAGGLLHVAAAVVGLSALLASSAVAFNVVRYAGAAYLVYLGVRALLTQSTEEAAAERAPVGRRRIFWHGVAVNVLNPKTALFFLAFLPQFIDPDAGSVALQAAVLGFCFVAIAAVSDGVYALLASKLGDRLRRGRLLARLSGGVFIGLGAFAAFSGERPTSNS